MYVVKRNGKQEPVHYDKITNRIANLCYGLDSRYIDPAAIAQKVIPGLYSGVHTTELDVLTCETCAYMSTNHPDYAILAGRVCISNLHKETKDSFSESMEELYPVSITDDIIDLIHQHKDQLNNAINHEWDYNYSYFAFKTLEKSYLLKVNDRIVERPQYMLMRVALGIHKSDIPKVIETYQLMAKGYFTHSTTTLFNAGTKSGQMSSCFLLEIKGDSIEGIYDTLKDCALISKSAGGIGINIHKIRAKGSDINGTNGHSNGIVPMLRVFNNTARYVDQGGGKRMGSFAVYLEPWHADIFEFLQLRINIGKEEMRARDLFYGLWIPDLFMRRCETDGEWSLFCPSEAPGLDDCYGSEFDMLYTEYERKGIARRVIPARKLWSVIVDTQIETGMPYMLYKDACNSKSNQSNLGTIKCSNLCTEIVEYTSPEEISVCNLASISLPKYVEIDANGTPVYNLLGLLDVVRVVTINLNRVIDHTTYPVHEAYVSNQKHRPIGIGVQGLADVFIKMRYPFTSYDAELLNKAIFETIYYGALSASCELAREYGSYASFEGSPASKGILQYDMWNVIPSNRYDWQSLKGKIQEYGLRNSLLIAPMPTASTAQILGNNESIEPYTSNMYVRRVLSGEFQVINTHLVQDLIKLGLWNDVMKNKLIEANGSVQSIDEIPDNIKELYLTAWELKQQRIISMAIDRGAYICQSQSLNIYMASPTYAKITSMHFYAWKGGLKTGLYYLRTKPATNPIQFTVNKELLRQNAADASITCSSSDECVVCSS